MEDIYTFERKEYRLAQSKPWTKTIALRYIAKMLEIAVKSIFFGILIVIKSIFYTFIPVKTKDIQFKVALVTGAANGIGRAIALELARYGCNVAIADVDYDAAVETTKDVRVLGVKAIAYKIDVSNYQEVVQLKEKVFKDYGTVDILVNNVGLLPRVSLTEGSPDDIMRIINVNLTSHFWTLRVFFDDMLKKGEGHIVATASTFALDASGREILYSSTKYAVRGLMDGLYELAKLKKSKLNVTTVFPSLVNTRKEYMDYFSNVNNNSYRMNPFYEMIKITPEKVAEATVDGILKNKKYVILPAFLEFVFKLFPLFPQELQGLLRDYCKLPIALEAHTAEDIVAEF